MQLNVLQLVEILYKPHFSFTQMYLVQGNYRKKAMITLSLLDTWIKFPTDVSCHQTWNACGEKRKNKNAAFSRQNLWLASNFLFAANRIHSVIDTIKWTLRCWFLCFIFDFHKSDIDASPGWANVLSGGVLKFDRGGAGAFFWWRSTYWRKKHYGTSVEYIKIEPAKIVSI